MATSTKRATKATTAKAGPRRSTVTKRTAAAGSRARSGSATGRSTGPRAAATSEQLVVCAAALVCGAIGFEARVFWVVSLVLMGLLMGLLGSRARAAGGQGVISEVVAGAKEVVDEVNAASGR